MKQRPRIYYSDTQKAMMWDRWKEGESLHSIARLFDRSHASVARILGETGGIRPPQRKQSRLALTMSEREEISRGVVARADKTRGSRRMICLSVDGETVAQRISTAFTVLVNRI